MRSIGLLAVALSLFTPNGVSASQSQPLTVGIAIGPTQQVGGSGSVAMLQAHTHLWREFNLDGSLRVGSFSEEVQLSPEQAFFALAVGPSHTWESGEWVGRTGVRFKHVHHTSTDNWRNNFWRNIAGDSQGDVKHRSGAELAIGLLSPGFTRIGDFELVVDTEVLVGWLPSSKHLEWSAGLTLGVSARSAD